MWKDVVFAPAHDLQLRLYKPADSTGSKLPVFFYFHGGGFCIGSRTWPNCQNYCFQLTSRLRAVVVAPDYRLAPENRLPDAIEDGFEALKWLQTQAVSDEPDPWLSHVADFSHVYISGDSAGGNIAHHLAARLGFGSPELDPVRVRGYVLLAPFFGGTIRTKSEAEGPKDAFLNLELIDRLVNWNFTPYFCVYMNYYFCIIFSLISNDSSIINKVSKLVNEHKNIVSKFWYA